MNYEMLETVKVGKGSIARDVMLQSVQGESCCSGETCSYMQCKGKGVVRERLDVTEGTRGKVVVGKRREVTKRARE